MSALIEKPYDALLADMGASQLLAYARSEASRVLTSDPVTGLAILEKIAPLMARGDTRHEAERQQRECSGADRARPGAATAAIFRVGVLAGGRATVAVVGVAIVAGLAFVDVEVAARRARRTRDHEAHVVDDRGQVRQRG